VILEAFVAFQIHTDCEGAGGSGFYEGISLINEVIFYADKQRCIAAPKKPAGGGQARNAKALLDQGIDRRIGMSVIGDENE
jgi:hypothetical protein